MLGSLFIFPASSVISGPCSIFRVAIGGPFNFRLFCLLRIQAGPKDVKYSYGNKLTDSNIFLGILYETKRKKTFLVSSHSAC
jgi:hypothetical protein